MKWFAIWLISVFLFACKESDLSEVKVDDLAAFVAEINAKQYAINDKLPTLIDDSPLAFTQQQARSPFFKPKLITSTVENENVPEGCLQLDLKRQKESLEAFSIVDLNMRGTLKINQQLWAIIEAPNGLFYKVKKGDYLGFNNGKITHVLENEIQLFELKLGRNSCLEKQATEIKLLLK